MDNGSERYGPCEICKKPVWSMYLQITEKAILHDGRHMGWSAQGSTFGHKACLLKKRK